MRELMRVPLDYSPVRCADALPLSECQDVFVYNHDYNMVHRLNSSAAIVWRLCDGTATVCQMVGRIAAEQGLEAEVVGNQLACLIAEWEALGLVRDARASSTV